MKKSFITLSLFIGSFSIVAQAPSIEWQKSLGGSGIDYANSIQQTTDGGYIVAGGSFSNDGDITNNHGGEDYWIVKLSDAGIIDWQKSLGGTSEDVLSAIQQTSDGGYIVAGSSWSNNGDVSGNNGQYDFWVVKLSNTGVIDWQKSMGGLGFDRAYSIQQTADGGYILCGGSFSNNGNVTGNHGSEDFWVVKLTNSGIIDWQKSFGGTNLEFANSIQQTMDGGFIVAGGSFSNDGDVTGNHGGEDYWVIKLTSIGNMQWQKSLGGTGDDRAKSIKPTTDGGFIVVGYSDSNNGDVLSNNGSGDYWLVKLTAAGTIDWEESLGGTSLDDGYSIQLTTDGGYVVAGYSESINGDVTGNHGVSDYWVVKLSSSGVINWEKSLGGNGYDKAYSIQITSDGGYIVGGVSYSGAGEVTGNHGECDFWVVKLSSLVGVNEIIEPNIFTVYPNPTSSILFVNNSELLIEEVAVYNILGEKVYKSIIEQQQNISIDISNQVSGIYFIEFTCANKKILKKIIKE